MKKFSKLSAIVLALMLVFVMCTGFTYANDMPPVEGATSVDFTPPQTEIVFDIGETTAISEAMDGLSAPVITPNGSVSLSSSVKFPTTASGTGYCMLYHQSPDSLSFEEYWSSAYGTASFNYPGGIVYKFGNENFVALESNFLYIIETTISNLEVGLHKFQFKFYSASGTASPIFSRVANVVVSPEILNISTIADVVVNKSQSKDISFTHGTNGELGNISYLWYLNGEAFEITKTPTLNTANLESGLYSGYCEIIPDKGLSTRTNAFQITVNNVATGGIEIVTQPQDVQVRKGESRMLSFGVSNAETVSSYQWYADGLAVPNATAREINLATFDVGIHELYNEFVSNEITYRTDISTVTIVDGTAPTAEPTIKPTTPPKPINPPKPVVPSNDGVSVWLWIVGSVLIFVVGSYFILRKK